MKIHYKAFTLVELLIVVVIIGILAGLVLSVLNPAAQRQRASEGVMRTQMAKVCAGLVACVGGNMSYNTASCNNATAINVFGTGDTITIGQPANSTYMISVPSAGTAAANYVRITGTLTGTGCSMTCDVANDLTDSGRNGTIVSTGCRT